MQYQYFVLIAIIIVVLVFYFLDTIKTNWIMYLTLKRGILSTNCGWWGISDYFTDTTGINLFNKFKKKDKIVPVWVFGQTIFVVTDIKFMKIILDNSPLIFGVGKFKFDFFKSFMKLNLGVSEGLLLALIKLDNSL